MISKHALQDPWSSTLAPKQRIGKPCTATAWPERTDGKSPIEGGVRGLYDRRVSEVTCCSNIRIVVHNQLRIVNDRSKAPGIKTRGEIIGDLRTNASQPQWERGNEAPVGAVRTLQHVNASRSTESKMMIAKTPSVEGKDTHLRFRPGNGPSGSVDNIAAAYRDHVRIAVVLKKSLQPVGARNRIVVDDRDDVTLSGRHTRAQSPHLTGKFDRYRPYPLTPRVEHLYRRLVIATADHEDLVRRVYLCFDAR